MGERTSILGFAQPMHLCSPPFVNDGQDITIIGAGLIGLCTADALAARGARVRVIDSRPGPCEGTSYSNSGMIHPSQAMSWEPAKDLASELRDTRDIAASVTARLAERSHQILMEKTRAFNLPRRGAGCLQLFSDLASAKAAQSAFTEIGIKADVQLDAEDTFGMAACYFPNDTSGDARRFGCALAEDLAARAVSFTYDAGDLDIRRQRNQFIVDSSKGAVQSDHLIIAAGAGSPDCLAQLGINMSLNPIAGAAADFGLPKDKARLPKCPIMDVKTRSALTVFETHVRISGGWQLTDPAEIISRWREIAPDLMKSLGAPLSTWTGVRPVSPIGRPYIGKTSIPNLWVNTGHGHMGWTLCAGSGELLAKLMLEGLEDERFAFSS